MSDQISRLQALALVGSMVGWEDLAEDQSRPLSPHCLTALTAILGVGQVPNQLTINKLSDKQWRPSIHYKQICAAMGLADLLIECGKALHAAIDEEPK